MKVKQNRNQYSYEGRMQVLQRIQRITYRGVKLRALERFCTAEEAILRAMENPLVRSQALDAARIAIRSIREDMRREQPGVPDPRQALRRRLFLENNGAEPAPENNEAEPVVARPLGLFFPRLPVARRLDFNENNIDRRNAFPALGLRVARRLDFGEDIDEGIGVNKAP